MKKAIFFTLIAVLLSTSAFAQRTTKMDIDLLKLTQSQDSGQTRAKNISIDKSSLFAKMLQNAGRKNDAPKSVKVVGVLKDGEMLPEAELKALGVTIEDNTYGIVDMRVPADKLLELDNLSAFRSFSAPKVSNLMNQKSHEVEQVDVVQDQTMASVEGLPQTYTGEGVIVGIFDQGIDFNHANFRDPETKQTRIKNAIIFRNFSTNDDGEFFDADSNRVSAAQIMEIYSKPAEIDTLTTDNCDNSHGTHTSSTAAGSYNGDYLDKNDNVIYSGQRGTAYKTDLVLAGFGVRGFHQFLRLSLAAMDSIATSEGKPLIVSLSLGNNSVWLDGKEDICLFYDRFTDGGNKPGRIVCISAGNEASVPSWIYKQLDADNDYTLRTFISKTYPDPSVFGNIDLANSDSTELEVSIEIIDTLTNVVKESLDYETLVAKGAFTYSFAQDHDNRYNGQLIYMIPNNDGEENLQPVLVVKSKNRKPCKVRMYVTCIGMQNLFYDYGREGYTPGDNKSSINDMVTTNSVLSVGAWSANGSFHSYKDPSTEAKSEYLNDTYQLNDIAIFSSFVETDDNGVSRPDFAAPGVCILSGFNAYNIEDENISDNLAGVAKEEYGRTDGKRSLLGMMNGTSMSCPNAAGIIALWLQANPELTVNQVREIIKATADKDESTAAYPARFGAGKINALAGLKYILKNYPTAIHKMEGLEEPMIQKVMEDGQIILIKNGVKYNVAGQRL